MWTSNPQKPFLDPNRADKASGLFLSTQQQDLQTIFCLSVTKVYLHVIHRVTFIFSGSAGGNAKLRYQITSGNTGGVFDVEPEVGTIFIAQPLDYEQNKR